MTIRSAALIGCLVWLLAGTVLTITNYSAPGSAPVASGFFKYADRTPLTP